MDAELDPLSAVLVSDVSNGALTLNSDGTFEYDPNDTFIGMDSFTYRADDGDANSNVATVTIDVKNSTPVANDDQYSMTKDTDPRFRSFQWLSYFKFQWFLSLRPEFRFYRDGQLQLQGE
jgi:VCBS repeat-containing protein